MHMYNYCKTCSARAMRIGWQQRSCASHLFQSVCHNEKTNCHQIVDIDIIAKNDPIFVAMKCVSPTDMSFGSASLLESYQGYFDVHCSPFLFSQTASSVGEMCSITPHNHDSCPVLMWSSALRDPARISLHLFRPLA